MQNNTSKALSKKERSKKRAEISKYVAQYFGQSRHQGTTNCLLKIYNGLCKLNENEPTSEIDSLGIHQNQKESLRGELALKQHQLIKMLPKEKVEFAS